MAVSKVNILVSDFSFSPQGLKTIDEMLDLIVKFLVSGFDPLAVESIVVTNKKARVTTVDKNFKCLAGVKMIINGTNNVELDARQEISETFNDGFIFDIDISDGIYNNNLTCSIAPLGWSLLQRDSTRLLLRCGNSATESFSVYFYLVNDSSNYRRIHYRVVYDALNFDTIKNIANINDVINFLPFFPGDSASYSSYFYKYWIYGDDLFFVMGCDKASNITHTDKHLFFTCSCFYVGELTKTYNNQSFHFLNGASYSHPQLSIDYADNESFNNGGTLRGIISKRTSKDSNISFKGGVVPKSTFEEYSGVSRTYSSYLSPTKQVLKQYEVITNDKVIVGKIPGCYYIKESIPDMYYSPYIPKKLNIDGKNINGVYIGMNGYTSAGVRGYKGVIFLNLTGPIR